MINITFQRNDAKTETDKVWHDNDSITLNGQPYQFPKGKNIRFESPNEQISDAYRDAEGALHAAVLKQYTKADRYLFENKENLNLIDQETKTSLKPINVKIFNNADSQKTVSELLFEKKAELQIIRQQILDAQADEDQGLLEELRPKRDRLRNEIQNLEANIE